MSSSELITGQTIAFDRIGNEQATPIVLLHGLSSNRRIYRHLADDLSNEIDQNLLQLINVDLRGHGESTHATVDAYDAVSYAADIAALIDQEVRRPAIIVAESLGGVIGAALATSRPDLVSGLFLEDPPLFLGNERRLSESPISSDFPETIKLISELQAQRASSDKYEDAMREAAEPNELADLAAGLPNWDPLTMQAAVDGILWRGYDPLRPISCPMTVVRADPAEGAAFDEQDVEPLQTANPDARIVMIPGASHSIRSSQPEQYARELDHFLASFI